MAGGIPPPPPGFTLDAPTGAMPKAPPALPPPPPGFTLDHPTQSLRQQQYQSDNSGFLQRLWNGMKGEDVSKTGRFGMGLADPAVGSAQMGAHYFEEQPIAWTAEQQKAVGPEAYQERVQAVDTAVQQREQGYQRRREAAAPAGEKPGFDLARLWGDIASPVNLMNAAAIPGGGGVATRGIPLAARMANAGRMGAMQGAIGGASQPVAGGDFGADKLRQMGLGAAGGAVAAPAATALGAGAGAAARGMGLVGTGERALQNQFSKAVKLPARGISSSGDIANAQQQAASAVKSIVDNKDGLTLTMPWGGERTGQLPETRGQFAEAIDQTKEKLFQQYDRMARASEDTTLTTGSPITKFNEGYDAATQRASQAQRHVSELDRALTLARAQQSRAGDNVYLSSSANASERQTRLALRKAEDALDSAKHAQEIARQNMSRPWVDLKPVASELQKVGGDRVMLTQHEDLAKYATKMAQRYGDTEAYSAVEAQRAIKHLNTSLKAFYDNPTYDTAGRAGIDAMIANKLREGLDTMIEKTVAPGYQDLKNQYGALSAIEKSVARSALAAINKGPGDSFLDHLMNVGSAEELMRGVFTLNPTATTRGLLLKAAQVGQGYLRNPDRAVRKLFEGAERRMTPQAPGIGQGIRQGFLPTTAGALMASSAGALQHRAMKLLCLEASPDGLLDLAIRAQWLNHEVRYHCASYDGVKNPTGRGLVQREDNWRSSVRWADLVVVGGAGRWMAELDGWRREGVPIIGGCAEAARLELDRMAGMAAFKRAGIPVPPFRQCSTLREAMEYVEKRGEGCAVKVCGDVTDKTTSCVGKTAEEILWRLDRWRREGRVFPAGLIVQDRVQGTEFAVGAWVGPDGYAEGWEENAEEKRLYAGGLGPNTGEAGTVIRLVKKSKLAEMMLAPFEDYLVHTGYAGNVDVNCIIDDDGNPWPLEWTVRLGWPAFNIELALHEKDPAEFLLGVAEGNVPQNSRRLNDVAVGVVMALPPYPFGHEKTEEVVDVPVWGIDRHNLDHLHFCQAMMKGDQVSTAGSYVLVATGVAEAIVPARAKAHRALEKLTVPASPYWRNDIGGRLRSQLEGLQAHGFAMGIRYA